MPSAQAVRDNNRVPAKLLEDPSGFTIPWKADNSTGYALLSVTTNSDTPTTQSIAVRDGNRVPVILLEGPDGNPVAWAADTDGNAYLDIEVA